MLLAVCLGCHSLPATAAAAGQDAAMAMGRLFAETCLRHPGDAAALRAALLPPRFRPIPPGVARIMLPRPGQAFEQPDAPGHLMVLSFDDGWCGNGGTGIDPGVLTNALSQAAASVGGVMKLMGADPDGHEQRYLLQRPHQPPVALLVLLLPADVAAGGPALVQASLFASEMRGDEGEEP